MHRWFDSMVLKQIHSDHSFVDYKINLSYKNKTNKQQEQKNVKPCLKTEKSCYFYLWNISWFTGQTHCKTTQSRCKLDLPNDVSCWTSSPNPLKCLTRPSFSLIGPDLWEQEIKCFIAHQAKWPWSLLQS